MAAETIGGVVYMRRGDRQLSCKGNITIRLGGRNRTAVTTADERVAGFTSQWVAPGFDMDIVDFGDLSLKDIQAIENEPLTIELGNGKAYILADAFYVGEASLNAIDGMFAAKFDGVDIQEIPR